MKTPAPLQYRLICSGCATEFSSFSKDSITCPKCSGKVLFTGYTTDEYRGISVEEKRTVIRNICGDELADNAEIADTANSPSDPLTILMTTTPVLQGYKIKRYLGIVSAARSTPISAGSGVISGVIQLTVDMIELQKMRQATLQILQGKAYEIGANAVIGLSIDFAPMNHTFACITAYGTAVFIEPESPQSSGSD